MNTWFTVKVKFDSQGENGLITPVTEAFLIDALSYAEAEKRILEEVRPYATSNEIEIKDIRKAKIAELFCNEGGDKWYKVKVNFCTIDEKTGKEKKTPNYMMVQAIDFKDAYDVFMEGMTGTMADFEISQIVETMIMDVYQADLSGAPKNKE